MAKNKLIVEEEINKSSFYLSVIINLKRRFLKEVKKTFPRLAPHLSVEEYGNHTGWNIFTSLKKKYTFDGEETIKDSENINKITFLVTVKYKNRLIERPIPVIYLPSKDKLEYDRSKLQTINRAPIMEDIENSYEFVNSISSQFANPYFLPQMDKIGSIGEEVEKAVTWFNKNFHIPKPEIREKLKDLVINNSDLKTSIQIVRTELKNRFGVLR